MPAAVYFVTGGARSGKSGYAQRLCESLSSQPIYLAMAAGWGGETDGDSDFKRRIAKHQADRGEQWTTVEEGLEPSRHLEQFRGGKAVMVDCLTLWLTNFMMKEGLFQLEGSKKDGEDSNAETDAAGEQSDASERALTKIQEEFDRLVNTCWDVTFVVVSNELGSGTHASSHVSRKFVDAQGWFNQYVSKRAEVVIHMVAGCPNVLKNKHGTKSDIPVVAAKPEPSAALEATLLDQHLSKRNVKMDSKGYFLVKLDREKKRIRVSFHSCIVNEKGEFFDLDGNRLKCHGKSPEPLKVWECRTAKEVTVEVLEQWSYAQEVVSIGHAGYLAREAQKAEAGLYAGTHFRQD